MKVRKHILYVAALAIVGALSAACSSGTDMEQAPQQKSEKTVILHGTVNAKSANATTRSVDANGITAWVSGEKIAVYYQKTNDSWDTVEATVGTPNSDGSAPITATLENPKACTVKLVYPASLANTTGSIDNTKLLNNQKGTISDISSNFDAATGSATITVSGSEATIPNFTMENQVCICKFTLKDASSNALNVTQFVINDGTNTYTVNPSPATSEITVAMLPATSANFSFTATTVSGNYKKSVASATLVAGKLYTSPMTLTLAQGKLLSSIAENAI